MKDNDSPVVGRAGAVRTVFAAALLLASALAAWGQTSAFEADGTLTADNPVDKLVLARLKQLDIPPARECSDAVFVRRVYLDTIGILPTAAEARDFILSRDSDKRAVLIDRLLQRPEFADYWAMKWCDVLRVKAEFPINLWPNAAQGYYHWIHSAVRENMPYDRFARELLTASGSGFRVPPANFYRAIQNRQPEGIAQAVALTFMGCRTEKWPKDRLAGMAAFFSYVGYKATSEWKEEIVSFDIIAATSQPASAAAAAPTFPDGTVARIPEGRDPRHVFSDWLVNEKNPWFARCAVNRIWYWLLGRGIIQEPDDIRDDNAPSSPQLLAYLERELVTSHYDLKHIYRLILNSKTYQLSCVPASQDPRAAANFAYYSLRRLDAEVLMDALCQVTGTCERYSSAIPEPFTFIPENTRSVELPDGSITSSFLDTFGRPPRDTGLASERNNRVSAAQRLYLLNSSHVQAKIEQGPGLQTLLRPRSKPLDAVTELYLTILSRFPTAEELQAITAYCRGDKMNRREAMVDIAWALLNSDEFQYRH